MKSTMRAKVRDFTIILAVLATFFLLFSLAVRGLTDYTVTDFLPGYSDMSDYFIGINTAIELGPFSRNAGYSGYIGKPDTLSVAPNLFYGGHGLFAVAPYIVLGKIVGWGGATPLFIHLILLAIAFSFVYSCTGNIKKTVAVQLLTLSFIPFLMFFGTMMMEVQMYVWAIVMTALTYAYINRPSRQNHFGLMAAIVLASFARITNAVFIVPYLTVTLWQLLTGRTESKAARKQYWINMYIGIATILACVVAFIVTMRFTAPYQNFYTMLAETWSYSRAEALRMFFAHVKLNIKSYLHPSATPIFVAMRYMCLGYGLFLLVDTFVKLDRGKFVVRFHIQSLCLCLLLAGAALLNIMFYDVLDWRDFRLLAPFFFATVVYAVLDYKRLAAPASVGVTLSLAFVIFLDVLLKGTWSIPVHFGPFHTNEFAYHAHYDPAAPMRYGNTILLPFSLIGQGEFHDLEAGLGAVGVLSSYTPEAMGQLGIKYIVRDADDPLPENEYYEVAASDDVYVLYVLR
jgi:hypothetical protein